MQVYSVQQNMQTENMDCLLTCQCKPAPVSKPLIFSNVFFCFFLFLLFFILKILFSISQVYYTLQCFNNGSWSGTLSYSSTGTTYLHLYSNLPILNIIAFFFFSVVYVSVCILFKKKTPLIAFNQSFCAQKNCKILNLAY